MDWICCSLSCCLRLSLIKNSRFSSSVIISTDLRGFVGRADVVGIVGVVAGVAIVEVGCDGAMLCCCGGLVWR